MRSNKFSLLLAVVAVSAGFLINANAADIPAAPELPVPAKVPYAFETFGPGAIKPGGWLLDWAQSAAKGITGHLDEWEPVYGMGWKAVEFEARGAAEEGTGWPLEQCAYWLDGLVRLAYILDDPALIAKAQARLDPVVEGALTGSPLFIHWRPMSQLDTRFDNWAHSHMGRALVAYYQATGDKKILDALVRVYSTFPLPFPDPGFEADVCGSVNLDPLIETYRMSGNSAVIENALAYASSPDFIALTENYNNQEPTAGHSVIFYENIRVPAVVYPWTGNREHLDATVNMLTKAQNKNGLPVGLISGEEYNSGTGSTRNIETCDVAAGALTINRLFRITGDRAYADRLERIFFNAGPAPVARDFKTMSYFQSMNRLEETRIAEPTRHPGGYDSYRFSNLGHEVLCCVGNLNRVIPNYIMNMWMKTPDNGIAATLYGPSRLTADIGGVDIELTCVTDYPFGEDLRIVVALSREKTFPLYLRIPEWCSGPVITLNGTEIYAAANDNGFAVISRSWKSGDEISLHFPMSVKVEQGRENDFPRIKYYTWEENRGLAFKTGIQNPYASVSYGPLLFALPLKDNTPNEMAPNAVWNYALDVSPGGESEIMVMRTGEMPDRWSWQLDAPVKLLAPARQFEWDPDNLQPLPSAPVASAESGKRRIIELVPYGVTKFRISMFPVTEESWIGE
jgi:uncharacterized protein